MSDLAAAWDTLTNEQRAAIRKGWDRRCHMCGEKVWIIWVSEPRSDCVEGAQTVTGCKYAMSKGAQRAEIAKAGGLENWSRQNPAAELII